MITIARSLSPTRPAARWLTLLAAAATSVSVLAQSAIENNNLISNGSFDANNGGGWTWWAGGAYFYNDSSDSIASIGWWDGINLYRNTGLTIAAGVDYVVTVRARNGDGHGAGIFVSIQDATQNWSTLGKQVHFFPDSEHTTTTGPWHTYTSVFAAADLASAVGDTMALAVGMSTNAAWNEQYGWLHIDWIQFAPAIPVFTAQPQDTNNFAGAPASFAVSVVGAVTNTVAPGTLTYQWYKSPATPIAGATSSGLVFTSLDPTNQGSYYVVVTGPMGSSQSDSATLTVQPANPPISVTDPQSRVGYPHQVVRFSITVDGTAPFYYQWQSNSVPITGATNHTLELTDISAASAATYSVVVTNRLGTLTRSATLSVVTPTPNTYEANILALRPSLYYRFSDIDGSTTVLNEGVLGAAADATVQGGSTGTDGPLPPTFLSLESTNRSVALDGYSADVSIPALNTPVNTMTLAAWIYSGGFQSEYAGIIFQRGGAGGASGLDVHPDSINSINTLAYHWANDFWGFNSGLVIPDFQWCLAALVVTPTNGTLYLRSLDAPALSNSVNVATHNVCQFGGITEIGWDNNGTSNARRFLGAIDEVMAFDRAFSAEEINQLYLLAVAPTLNFTVSNGQLILTWSTGTLQAATAVTGPYSDVTSTSPYNATLNSPGTKFFRLRR